MSGAGPHDPYTAPGRASFMGRFSIVSGATLASRISGFGRDVLLAAFLGAGPVADAFFVAFRLPNLFRRLFAEGMFSPAFVPLFRAELTRAGRPEAMRLAREVIFWLGLVLLVGTVLAGIFMPVLVAALAPGFDPGSVQFAQSVLWARLAFPFLAFIAFASLFAGMLNSIGHFMWPALAPVLLNAFMIAALCAGGVWLTLAAEQIAAMLAIAVMLSGLVQALLLVAALHRLGLFPLTPRPRLGARARRMLALMVPSLVAGGATQINIVVGTAIASAHAGAISFLYYADRVYQLPLALIGIAIATVLLPDLAHRIETGALKAANGRQNMALELAMLMTVPASVALVVVPVPVVSGLFEYGHFGPQDTRAAAAALSAYGAGLPAFVLIKIASPAFFARKDTASPMWIALAAMLANVVLALLLAGPLRHVGIALATSLAGWMNALVLILVLMRRGDFRLERDTAGQLVRQCAAALAMGVVVTGADALYVQATGPGEALWRIVRLVWLVVAGILSYGIFAWLCGALRADRLRAAAGLPPPPTPPRPVP